MTSRQRVRRTALIAAATAVALLVFSMLYIARNGRRSTTVLHSEAFAVRRPIA